MVTPEKVMSVGAQHALKDMVELQMYLLAQPQQTPWPMLPRTMRTLPQGQKPYSNPVESSAAHELIDRGFIEQSSNRTFVVSKIGYEFHRQNPSSPG